MSFNHVLPLSLQNAYTTLPTINSGYGLIKWVPCGQGGNVNAGYQDYNFLPNTMRMTPQGSGTAISNNGYAAGGEITCPSGAAGFWQDANASGGTLLPAAGTARTLMAWVIVPNFTDHFVAFGYGNPLTNGQGCWMGVEITTGRVESVWTGGTYAGNGTALVANQPTHIAITFGPPSTNASQAIHYKNGIRNTSSSLTAGTDRVINTVVSSRFIDRIQSTTFGQGTIWDVRIYNRVLSDEEIFQIYAESSMGPFQIPTQSIEMPIMMDVGGGDTGVFLVPSQTINMRQIVSMVGY